MRASWLAAAALAVGPAVAQAPPAASPSWIARRLEEGFSRATGGTLTIGALDVEWTALSAQVRDVALTIPAGDAPPLTATIARGRIRLDWADVAGLATGRVHLASLEAEGATFACTRAWIEAFRPRRDKEGGSVEIRVDHLGVTGGTADFADEGLKVRLHATGVSYAGDWSVARRLLAGEVRGDVRVEAPPFSRPWPASVRGGMRIGPRRIEIVSATGRGPGAEAELSGTVLWGAGASFIAEGRADVDFEKARAYLPGHLALGGRAAGPVRIVYVSGSPVRVVADAATTGFRIGPIASERARGEVTIRPGGIDVDRIDARAYGGAISGRVSVALGATPRLEVHVAGRGADVRSITALAGKELPLAANADLTLDLTGDPAAPASWQGAGTFDATAAPAAAGRVPVSGKGTVAFDAGAFRLASERLEMGSGAFALRLEVGLAGRPLPVSLALEGTTRDAAATQAAALVLLDALGVPRNRFATEPLAGAGTLAATVRAGDETELELRSELTGGSYAAEPFDRARVEIAVGPRSARVTRLEVARGGERLAGAAAFALPDGDLESVELHARGLVLERILARFGAQAGILGTLEGDLTGDARDGTFAASGSVSVRGLVLGREIVDEVATPVRVEGSRVYLEDCAVRGLALNGRLRASFDLASRTGTIETAPLGIDLAASRTLAEAGIDASGTVEARGSLAVAPEGPSGLLTVAASRAELDLGRAGYRRVALGDLTGSVALAPQGMELAVRALPQSAWTFEAFLGWRPSLPLSAVLYFDDLLLEAGSALGQTADVRLRGQIQAEGDLTDPRAMEINGAFDQVDLRLGPRTLRSAAPFPLRLESGRFAFGPSAFVGDGARVEMTAGGSIEGGAIEGRLAGTVDLGMISSLWSDLRASGPVSFDVTLAGTTDAPELSGEVAVSDGRVRLLGYATSLESIEAKARFSGQSLTLTSFRALSGGGEIAATGRLALRGLAPDAFHAEFTVSNVTVAAPEGFRGAFDGSVRVDGTPKGATVSARLTLASGLYSKNFDLSAFGGARREYAAEDETPMPRNVLLDVDVTAPGTIVLRNDSAKLEASGTIHVGGELARPEITGRIAIVPGGMLTYRDVDYRLDYGTVDLTDRNRINPYVDIRGHTRVGSWEISLRVEGTADHFEYELTSTPPLSSQDIISVLVTGRTLDTLSGTASASALPADMAASYFAGLLTSTFGKQIQQSLGIDQLEVTPLLLKGETDPTARVTVGKRVRDDLKIVFSQDIGTAERQTYQIVWDSTRRIRVIAESDTQTGLGGEVQYSQQLGGARAARAGAEPAAGTEPDAPGTVASVAIRDAADHPLPALYKAPKIRPGDPFNRGAMYAGAERIRAALVEEGRIESTVRPEAAHDAASGTYAIVYRVHAGEKIATEVVTTDGKGRRDLRKALKTFVRETPYAIDYWDVAARSLATRLSAAGYYAAEVAWTVGQDARGRRVRFEVDRGKPVRLRSLAFHGVSRLPLARIEAQVTSLRSGSLKKRLLKPAQLTEDLAAVRALYRDEGYARVVVGAPAIRLAAAGNAADVDVTVDEGERYVVGSIAFPEDLPVPPSAMAAAIPLKVGGTYAPRLVAESEQALRADFDRRGYPDVGVDSGVTLDRGKAVVSFSVTTGEVRRIARIDVEGNRITRRNTITNALTFGVGDPLSRDRLLESQQHLYRMGLFSDVKMTFAPVPGGEPGASAVTVRVQEAPPYNLGVGAGYDSEDGPRASFLLGYSNLAGRDIGIALQGFFSSKDKRGQLTLRRRQIFGLATDSLASLLYERTVETGFTQTRRGISVRLEKRPKPLWIRFVRYNIQQVKIGDVTNAEDALDQIFEDKLSAIRLASAGVGLVRDTRDDAFSATRGGYASVEGNVFSRYLGSEADFAKVFLRGSVVITLPRGIRFAGFLRVGAEQPYSGTSLVPLSERFFAGGSNTLRGFDTDSVGGLIVEEGGQTFRAGGEGLFILNEELHLPLWKALRGVVFLDAGNVYPTIHDFDPLDLRSSSGLGLRLDTPIGPIRAEYGWKLDRREGESGGAFYFSIGALF